MCYKDLPEVGCGWCRFEGLREFTRKLFIRVEFAKLRATNLLDQDWLGLRFTRVGRLVAGHHSLRIGNPIINRC